MCGGIIGAAIFLHIVYIKMVYQGCGDKRSECDGCEFCFDKRCNGVF